MEKPERKPVYDYAQTEEGKRRFANPEIYQRTLEFQQEMMRLGVAWHNHFTNECTIDFCCCHGDNLNATNYQHYIPSFREVLKLALSELFEQVKHGDKQHQDWLENEFKRFVKNFDS